MVPGPIPWSSIHKWAEFHGITDPDDLADFIAIIRMMEFAIRKHDEKGAPQ